MSGFVSLTSAVEPWFETDWQDLPPEIQGLLKRRFPPAVDSDSGDPRRPVPVQFVSAWDSFSPNQRRISAEQSDFNNDPAYEWDRETMGELQDDYSRDISQLKDENAQLKELSPWARQFDFGTRGSMLTANRRRLAALEAQERELLDAQPAAELHSTLERLTALRSEREEAPDSAPTAGLYPLDEDVPSSIVNVHVPGKAKLRGDVGRPGVTTIAIEQYEKRRLALAPLGGTRIAEATEILKAWPSGRVPKPQAQTVAERISKRWARDKLADKL